MQPTKKNKYLWTNIQFVSSLKKDDKQLLFKFILLKYLMHIMTSYGWTNVEEYYNDQVFPVIDFYVIYYTVQSPTSLFSVCRQIVVLLIEKLPIDKGQHFIKLQRALWFLKDSLDMQNIAQSTPYLE